MGQTPVEANATSFLSREWERAQVRLEHPFCSFIGVSCLLVFLFLCSVPHGPIWESLSKLLYKCDALKHCRYFQMTVNTAKCRRSEIDRDSDRPPQEGSPHRSQDL